MGERYNYIDFLRFIGLSMIILAHSHAPGIIHQIRCFDVPLMIFVSGLSYSRKTAHFSWKGFTFPRLLRLIVPTYLFLLFYFLLMWFWGSPASLDTIVGSFMLLQSQGIGYVWIIKVFVLLTLFTPLIIKLNERLNLIHFGTLILSLLLVQEVLVYFLSFWNPVNSLLIFFKESILSIVAYSILFLLGLRLRFATDSEEKKIFVVVAAFAVLSLCFLLIHNELSINIVPRYKYPPYRFYIVYGVFASSLLWFMRRWISKLPDYLFFIFVGRNTMWIYLWQIIGVGLAEKISGQWIVKFLIIYVFSISIFYIQYLLVKKGEQCQKCRKFLKYLIG